MGSSDVRGTLFWPVIALVVVSDVITKWIAVLQLQPRGIAHPVFGETVRLTLVYNTGAAFGLRIGGDYSRWVFLVLTVAALVILWQLYKSTKAGDVVRTLAIALVCGGAIGNLIDRVRSAQGVVDFIDIGIGNMRWPTFNVADMAVSTGAVLLAWVLWGEERAERASPAAVSAGASEPS